MRRELVDQSHSWFRRWFRKVWEVRGGGLYACGFAITFIILELQSLGEDVAGIGGLFEGGIVAFVVDIFIDSLMNTIGALLWPVEVVQLAPPWGAIGLGLAYVGFASYLKPPIERWLFDGEPAELTDKPERIDQ